MRKQFCDLCKEEIKEGEEIELILGSGSDIEICDVCENEITKTVRRLTKERKF